MPEFIRSELGPRVLDRAAGAAGIDVELIAAQDGFMPHARVVAFIDALARAAGDGRFGLRIVPGQDVARYGCWSAYVLGAATLGEAIRRAIGALHLHSTGDRMSLGEEGGHARFGYVFALAGRPGYAQLAAGAAGALLSLCRLYAPPGWRPLRVELDLPRPPRPSAFEDAFGCPVGFGAESIGIVMHLSTLAARRPRRPASIVTIEDVARARRGGAPADRFGVIAEQVRLQVVAGTVSLDGAARALDTSARSLQREIAAAGTDFRSLAGNFRLERAVELLRQPEVSITAAAAELGYSAPAHFTRAFRKATGQAPRAFRRSVLAPRVAAE